MYFSQHFQVRHTKASEWFDPILTSDTRLFVDPFMIYKETEEPWVSAHGEMIAYFQRAFELLAPVVDKPNAPAYRKVLHLMSFPEPKAFRLGYVEKGDGGAGTSLGFAKRIVEGMTIALRKSIDDIRHFEELTLLVERIGPDRISDATCNILIARFIEYTQGTCRRLGVPLVPQELPHAVFDPMRRRWESATLPLPQNPENGKPVLLTPHRFLRELPQLNADDWFDQNAGELRNDFNLDANERLNKTDIVKAARQRPDLIKKWSAASADRVAWPYDVPRDPAGLHNWLAVAQEFTRTNPLTHMQIDSVDDLRVFIEGCLLKFKNFVEHQGGWRLLWDDAKGTPKREESVQLLLRGIIQGYCESAGVILDREVELGRGPVDFAFSATYALRSLMEVKKLSSSVLWEGLESQLISYMTSDDSTKEGWYLVVQFRDTDIETQHAADVADRTRELAMRAGFNLRSMLINARPPKSASKIRKTR